MLYILKFDVKIVFFRVSLQSKTLGSGGDTKVMLLLNKNWFWQIDKGNQVWIYFNLYNKIWNTTLEKINSLTWH